MKPVNRFRPIKPAPACSVLAALVGLCVAADRPDAPAAAPPAPTPPAAAAVAAPAGSSSSAATPQPGGVPQGEGEREVLADIVQLTSGSQFEKAGEGYFSPDMKWVVFQGVPKGEAQYQMYVAPLDLTGGPPNAPSRLGRAVRITPANSRNTCGFFSPDGRSLIFASTAGKENPDEPSSGYQRKDAAYKWAFPTGMEIYRSDDWHAQVAAAIEKREGAVDLVKSATRLTNNAAYDAEDAYSPDGKWICFTSLRTGDAEVFVMRADGSHVTQITHVKGYDGGPFFSPDGKRLVYRSDRKGNDLLQLFVADLAFDAEGNITGLAAEHQLTDDNNVNWGPYWYPDGQHLIFATSRHGHQNYELYTIRSDGSHAARVTYTDGFDGLPAFSPDGKYLMWSSKRAADNTVQLFLAQFHAPKDW